MRRPFLRKRFRRQTLAICLSALIALVGVAIIRISEAPVSLEAWRETAERAIEARVGDGATAQVAGLSMRWASLGDGPMVTLERPVIAFPDGREALALDQLDLWLSPVALLTGRVKPHGIAVRGGVLAPPAGGGVGVGGFSFEGIGALSGIGQWLSEHAHRLTEFGGELEAAGFRRIEITGTRLRLGSETVHEIELARVKLKTSGARELLGRAEININPGGVGGEAAPTSSFAFTIRTDPQSQAASATFALRDLVPDSALNRAGQGLAFTAPIGADGEISIDEAGLIREAAMDVFLGEGAIGPRRDPRKRVPVESAAVNLSLNSETGDVDVSELSFRSGNAILLASGTARSWPGDPSGQSAVINLDQASMIFDEPNGGERIVFDRAEVGGILDIPGRALRLKNIALISDEVQVSLAATVDWSSGQRVFSAMGASSRMSVAQLKSVWLPFISPPARNWIIANVSGGHVVPSSFSLSTIPGERRLRTTIDGGLEKTAFTYYQGLNAVTVDRASLTLRTDRLTMEMARGDVFLPSGARLSMPGGQLLMTNIGLGDVNMTAATSAQGSIPAFVEYITNSNMPQATAITFTPEDVTGEADLRISVQAMLSTTPGRTTGRYEVNGVTRDLGSDSLVRDMPLSDGDLSLAVDPDGLMAEGKIAVRGVPSQVRFRRFWKSDGENPSEVELTSLLDAAAQRELGLDLGTYLDGPIQLDNVTPLDGSEVSAVSLDLGDAVLRIPEIDWEKPAGVPGRISFEMRTVGEETRLQDFRLEAPGILAAGEVILVGDSGLRSARFEQLRLSSGDSATLSVVVAEDGGVTMDFTGAQFDLRPILDQPTRNLRADDSGAARSLRVNVDIGRLIGMNNEELLGFKLSATMDRGALTAFQMSGTARNGAPLNGGLTQNDGQPLLVVRSSNAGALLRFVDVYHPMRGGQLDLRARQVPGPLFAGDWAGAFTITNFVARNDPVIETLVGQSRIGSEAAPQIGAQQGTPFSVLQARFRRRPGVIEVENGVLKGPVVGITFGGKIDFDRNDTDIAGTFVPIFALNNAFSQVPVFGRILGGSPDEGLLGITYRVSGPLRSPQLSYNPLSAVAPGIFREIFEFGTGNGTADDPALPRRPIEGFDSGTTAR